MSTYPQFGGLNASIPLNAEPDCAPSTLLKLDHMESPGSIMARERSTQHRIGILERKLGFFTERGLSRTPSAHLPKRVQDMVEAMDEMKKGFIPCTTAILENSPDFERAWKHLLWQVKDLWHGDKGEQTLQIDIDLYPRPLNYDDPTDRQKCVHHCQSLPCSYLTWL